MGEGADRRMTTGYRRLHEPQREDLRVRGLGMRITRWRGPGSAAAPIVMLHGWLDCGESFQFIVDALRRDAPVVAPDWRGFGGSEWPQDGYWFPDYLADLDALLRLISPAEPVALVGHSMGGNIASLYAGLRPERVKSLVNIEGLGMTPAAASEAPERLRKWLDQVARAAPSSEYDSFEQFATVIRRHHPRISAERAAYVAALWARADLGDRVRQVHDPRHRFVNPILYRREEAEACWREIRAPALLILGAESELPARLKMEDAAAPFRRAVPHAEVVRIADAGHLLHLDQPEAVASAIETFLARH